MINKKILNIIVITLLIVNFSLAEQLYSLSLVKTDQGLAYSNIEISQGEIPQISKEGNIIVRIFDFSDNLLYENKVSPPSFQPFQLLVPYYKEGKQIELIYEQDNPISIEVAYFADTCGNTLCEEHENFNICSEDCHSGKEDSYCDKELDYICDPDCTVEEDLDCKVEEEKEKENISEKLKEVKEKIVVESKEEEEEKGFPWWIILLVVIFILIIMGLIYYDKKKHEKEKLKVITDYMQKYLQQRYTSQQIKLGLIKYGYNKKDIEKAYKLLK